MGSYQIDLKNLTIGVHGYDYLLENGFFAGIEGDLVQKGKVRVHLTLRKSAMMFELDFHLEGTAVVPCDRCLDDVELPINTDSRLVVKFGEEYAEESDEVLIIPEDDGTIDLAWFLYEFVALAVPMKHVHAPGECNKEMYSELRKYRAVQAGEEDDFPDVSFDEDDSGTRQPADPRWDALKNLIENNNN